MSAKFTDLHCKEVICISNGQRLGMIEDVIIQLPKGEVTAIVVPGRCKLGGLAGPRDDFVIPWCNICRIGPDIVLVDIKPDDCRVLRNRPKLMF
jgi:YlmC/YmxH family sporulation protein